MLFDLNGSKFMVKFSRINAKTFAELWQYDEILKFWDCLNIMGIAERSMKDRFEKSKGRKIALKKLFQRMNVFAFEDNNSVLSNTKEQRTKIWEIYFKEHKK
jgi:hypothetical protein